MDSTSKKIAHFLESSDPELRLSSLRILIELGLLKGEVLKTLEKIIAENDAILNQRILSILAIKPIPELMKFYVPFLKIEGVSREKALQALESLGTVAAQTIQKQYANADDLTKRSFISLLTRVPSRSNFDFISNAILSEPFELLQHICSEYARSLAKHSDKEKKVFETVIREHIRIAEKNKNHKALTSYAILLGYLELKSSLHILMRYAEAKYPIDLRREALISLGKITAGGKVEESVQRTLLSMLPEADYLNIVQYALGILDSLAPSKSFEKVYLELMMTNPHNAVKNFALGKLAQSNSKVALEKLTSQLMSGDVFLYEKAQKVLEKSEKGVDYLLNHLDEISSVEAAERIGGLLAMDRSRISPAQLNKMLQKAEKHLGEPNEKARIYFTLVKRINPDIAFENIMEKVESNKTKKNYVKAKALLDLMSGTLLFNNDVRFKYAVLQLKLSKKNLEPMTRNQDPAILLFQSIIPQKNFGLFDKIKQEKILSSEDIFYLGFHFAEKLFDQKDFGIQALKYVATKFSSSSYASKAKKKLSALGISGTLTSHKKKG